MQKHGKTRRLRPKQEQAARPGREDKMKPKPQVESPEYRGSGKLDGKVAIISGGDSGIGRAVAVAFAKEGADVVISYLNEHKDAAETARMVEEEGQSCEMVPGDIGDPRHCKLIVQRTMKKFRRLDILVNNAAEQHPQDDITKITPRQLERTYRNS